MEQTNLFRSSKNTSKPVPDIFLDLSVKIRNSSVLSFSWGVLLFFLVQLYLVLPLEDKLPGFRVSHRLHERFLTYGHIEDFVVWHPRRPLEILFL